MGTHGAATAAAAWPWKPGLGGSSVGKPSQRCSRRQTYTLAIPSLGPIGRRAGRKPLHHMSVVTSTTSRPNTVGVEGVIRVSALYTVRARGRGYGLTISVQSQHALHVDSKPERARGQTQCEWMGNVACALQWEQQCSEPSALSGPAAHGLESPVHGIATHQTHSFSDHTVVSLEAIHTVRGAEGCACVCSCEHFMIKQR